MTEKMLEELREVETLRKIVAFLLGNAPLDGVWFGDKPDGKTAFWWRTQLSEAFRAHHSAIEAAVRDAARWRFIAAAPAGTVRADFNALVPAYYYWGNGKSLDEQIDTAIAHSGREGRDEIAN